MATRNVVGPNTAANPPLDGTARPQQLTDRQRRLLEEICTSCNALVSLCTSAVAHPDAVDSLWMLYMARDTFQRIGAVADGLNDFEVKGCFEDWLGVEQIGGAG